MIKSLLITILAVSGCNKPISFVEECSQIALKNYSDVPLKTRSLICGMNSALVKIGVLSRSSGFELAREELRAERAHIVDKILTEQEQQDKK